MNHDRVFPKVPGAHGGSMAATNVNSVRDCRLSDKKPPTIRVKSQAGVCGGFVRESMEPQRTVGNLSKNAWRKAARYGTLPAHLR